MTADHHFKSPLTPVICTTPTLLKETTMRNICAKLALSVKALGALLAVLLTVGLAPHTRQDKLIC